MDPYGDHNRKIVSPLDKVQVEKAKIDTPDHQQKYSRNNGTRRSWKAILKLIRPLSTISQT